MLYLYSKLCFVACVILCASEDHLSEQNRGLLMIFLKKCSTLQHLEMGMCIWDLETFENSVLNSTKIRRRQKKSPAKFWQKNNNNFLGT